MTTYPVPIFSLQQRLTFILGNFCCHIFLVSYNNYLKLFRYAIAQQYLQRNLLMLYQMDGKIMHGIGSIKGYICRYFYLKSLTLSNLKYNFFDDLLAFF